jgi:hypothetical protein
MHLVLDHGDPLQLQVPVRDVDATSAPVPRREHEGRQPRGRLDEILRNRAGPHDQPLAIPDPAAVGVHAAPVGKKSADAVACHSGLLDHRRVQRRLRAAHGEYPTARGTAAEHGVAADHAALHVDDVGVNTAAKGATVARWVEIALHVIVVDRAVAEPRSPPDRDPPAARQCPGLVGGATGRKRLRNVYSARDRDVAQCEVAVDRKHASGVACPPGPGNGNARRQVRGVEYHVLASVERRTTIVAVEVADQIGNRSARLVPHAHHFALQDRVLFADDREHDGSTVEPRGELDGLPAARPRERRA